MKEKIELNNGTILMIKETGIENLYHVEWIQDNKLLDSGDFNIDTIKEYEGKYEEFCDEYFMVI